MGNTAQQRFLGGVEQNFKKVVHATGPYTAAIYDALTRIDTRTGTIGAITLPNTVPVGTARQHAFVDMGGEANVNPITILAPGGGSINGVGSLIINVPYGGVIVATEDGLNYDTVVTDEGLGAIVGPSNAVYVDPAGNDTTGTRGNFALPFLTIEAAFAATHDGDEVLIAPGSYQPTIPLTPPGGVTHLIVRGSGNSVDTAAPLAGTTIDGSLLGGTAVFNFLNLMNYVLFENFIVPSPSAGLRFDGTTSAGQYGLAGGIFIRNVTASLEANFVNTLQVCGGEIISSCVVNTCSNVLFEATDGAVGVSVTWDDTSGTKPSSGRVKLEYHAARTGGITVGGQAVVEIGKGSTCLNIVGAALSVANGLAPQVRCYGRVTDIVNFNPQLPDTAVACVMDFDGALIQGATIAFGVVGSPPTHRQTVSMRNATVPTAIITAGNAVDIDTTSLALSTGLQAQTSGTPLGTFLQWRMNQDLFTQVSALTPSLGVLALLDSFYGGTFTRASIAAEQYRAARTDGLPWMSWTKLQSGVRRCVDLGDGSGERLRIEIGNTNLLTKSCFFDNAAWTKTGVTVTADFNASPDEGIFGQRLVYAAVATNEVLQAFSTAANVNATGSVWLRCAAGTENIRLVLLDRTGAETIVAVTVTTTWTRYTVSYGSIGAGAGTPAFKIRNGADGLARTVFATMAQAEATSYPTSEIFTDTATVARAAEVLIYNEGAWPASFRTSGFTFSCWPDGSNGDLAAQGGNAWGLWGANTATEYIRLSYTSAVQGVVQVSTNSGVIFTKNVTWAKGAKLTIQVQPSLGNLILSGFLTGNGTFNTGAWTFLNGPMTYGDTGAAIYFAGDLSRFITG